MQYIECPDEYTGDNLKLFLAGGISNCGDWQAKMPEAFKDTDLILVNPRRKSFDITVESDTIFQIEWEHKQLNTSDLVLFWFPHETLCPITLFELGARLMTDTPVFIGVDPNYARKLDVEQQTRLVRPEIEIVSSLDDLVEQVKHYVGHL